jgi:hypothetical protein
MTTTKIKEVSNIIVTAAREAIALNPNRSTKLMYFNLFRSYSDASEADILKVIQTNLESGELNLIETGLYLEIWWAMRRPLLVKKGELF